MSLLEANHAVWPLTQPLPAWLDRVLISPLFRWDAHIYNAIAVQGFSLKDGTASFHPLYPLLARPLMALGLSPQLSLILVSSFAGLGFFYYYYRLARMDFDQETAHTSLLLILFSPLSFLFFVPYSESVFLLLAVLSLLSCRKQKWWLAGFFGGLATLTRQQGLFLVIPLAWELWEESHHTLQLFCNKWKSWFAILLIPLSYTGWILYRGLVLNDVSFEFSRPLDSIYSVLLSPSTTQVVPHFRFLFPWQAISLAIEKIRLEPDIDTWTNLVLGVVLVMTAIISWPQLRNSYRLFVLTNVLVALSFNTGSIHPYMGMPRHIWLAFPIFLGLGAKVQKPWLRILVVVAGMLVMTFLLFLYVLEAWVT